MFLKGRDERDSWWQKKSVIEPISPIMSSALHQGIWWRVQARRWRMQWGLHRIWSTWTCRLLQQLLGVYQRVLYGFASCTVNLWWVFKGFGFCISYHITFHTHSHMSFIISIFCHFSPSPILNPQKEVHHLPLWINISMFHLISRICNYQIPQHLHKDLF